ncbi:phospholipid scramblase 2 [Rhipicephalus microplus]|uniref:phospholipid scramblase 2 n=1 Tax=Rhipicephalus microplus TaxID=6941 RepID=UPI003F6CFF4D
MQPTRPQAATARPSAPPVGPTATMAPLGPPVIPMAGGAGTPARPVVMVMPPVVTVPPGGVRAPSAAVMRPGVPFVQMPVQVPELEPIPGCPPGLEYLTRIDQMLVHQQLQLLEMLVPYEQQNKYVVKNTMGQFIFMANEESDLASRCCLGSCRPFEMALLDYRSVEVMRLYRPLRCDSCLCFCCLQVMDVHAPPGTIIGSLRQECTAVFPLFSVLDSRGNVVLQIQGPFCTTAALCNDIVFDITTRDGKTKIGQITKNWSGLLREAFTDVDNFTVVFPIDLDVRMKAVLLGAAFLIDFIYFETGASGPIGGTDLPGNVFN